MNKKPCIVCACLLLNGRAGSVCSLCRCVVRRIEPARADGDKLLKVKRLASFFALSASSHKKVLVFNFSVVWAYLSRPPRRSRTASKLGSEQARILLY